MPSHPIATWKAPCSSRKGQVFGTSPRRHTIGLMPSSQTLICTITSGSAKTAPFQCRGWAASELSPPAQLVADRPSRREHPTDPDALLFGEGLLDRVQIGAVGRQV